MINRLFGWLRRPRLHKQQRYPALAQANRVLLLIQSEVTDFASISSVMERYKQAQDVPESERDLAYIPIYLELEQFVCSNQPPVTKRVLSPAQIRREIAGQVDLSQMGEMFRLVFLPSNQQIDHLLKTGIIDVLRFLLTSLGPVQLRDIIASSAGVSPLTEIEVTDDGVGFAPVHLKMAQIPDEDVVAAYTTFYRSIFNRIKELFGAQKALDLMNQQREKIRSHFSPEFVALFDQTWSAISS